MSGLTDPRGCREDCPEGTHARRNIGIAIAQVALSQRSQISLTIEDIDMLGYTGIQLIKAALDCPEWAAAVVRLVPGSAAPGLEAEAIGEFEAGTRWLLEELRYERSEPIPDGV